MNATANSGKDPGDCYCGGWETDPQSLEAQRLPRGYCAWCERCGAPGHQRHFPGTAPVTGQWCDRHYRRLAVLHPLGHVGRYLYSAAAALLLLAIVLGRSCQAP